MNGPEVGIYMYDACRMQRPDARSNTRRCQS